MNLSKKNVLLRQFILLNICLSLTYSSLAWGFNKTLAPGLEYRQLRKGDTEVHLLQIDPKRIEMTVVHAWQLNQGLAYLKSFVEQTGAIAGINGGFFDLTHDSIEGVPTGILKINSIWYAQARRNRAAIAWNPRDLSPEFNRLKTQIWLETKKQHLAIPSLNQAPSPHRTVLYTDAFYKSLQCPPQNLQVIIENQRIAAIQQGGEIEIKKGRYVLCLPAKLAAQYPFQIGEAAHIHFKVIPLQGKPEDLDSKQTILGGTPILIWQGQAQYNYQLERLPQNFIHGAHSRTALGILANGHWLAVVVEQASLQELTEILLELGCVMAINLDGGTSSGLYADGHTTHFVKPFGFLQKHGRKVANAILFSTR